MSSNSLIDSIEKYKDDFYKYNSKNIFLKKSQKLDCAKKISENFSIKEMINATIYIIPNTNKIIFDYTIFKLYANDNIYLDIIQHIKHLYDILLQNYKMFEIHVILDTFTITAAERYKYIIKLFCENYMNIDINNLQCIYIYYTPSMIDSISILLKPFIKYSFTERVIYYSKAESPSLLQKLYLTK